MKKVARNLVFSDSISWILFSCFLFIVFRVIGGLIFSNFFLDYEISLINSERIFNLQTYLNINFESVLQASLLMDWISFWNIVYITFYFGSLIIVPSFFLFKKDYSSVRKIKNVGILIFSLHFVISSIFPVAPPKSISGLGIIDTIQDTAFGVFYSLNHKSQVVGDVSAVPSMHLGLSALWVWGFVKFTQNRFLQFISFLNLVLIFLSTMITGNHFFIDGVLGIILVVLVVYFYEKFEEGYNSFQR